MTKLLLVFVFFQWANVSLIDITVRAQESGSSGISIPMPSNGLVGSVPSADFSDELYNTLPSIPSASRVSDLLESKDLQTFLATRFNAYGAYGETHEGEIDLDWKNILEELNNNSNSSHSSLSTSDSSEASLTDLTAIDLEYVYAKWKEEQEGSRCEDSACLEKKLKEAFGEIEAEEVETSFGKQILYKIAGRELKTQEDWTWFMQSRGLPIVGLTAYGLYGLYRRRREENERYKSTWEKIEAYKSTQKTVPSSLEKEANTSKIKQEQSQNLWDSEIAKTWEGVKSTRERLKFDGEEFNSAFEKFFNTSETDQALLLEGSKNVTESQVWAAKEAYQAKEKELKDRESNRRTLWSQHQTRISSLNSSLSNKIKEEAKQKFPGVKYYNGYERLTDAQSAYVKMEYSKRYYKTKTWDEFEEWENKNILAQREYTVKPYKEKSENLEFQWQLAQVKAGGIDFNKNLDEIFPAEKTKATEVEQDQYISNYNRLDIISKEKEKAEMSVPGLKSRVGYYESILEKEKNTKTSYDQLDQKANKYWYEQKALLRADTAKNPYKATSNGLRISEISQKILKTYWGRKAFDQSIKVRNLEGQRIFAQRSLTKAEGVLEKYDIEIENLKTYLYEDHLNLGEMKKFVETKESEEVSQRQVFVTAYTQKVNSLRYYQKYSSSVPPQYRSRYSYRSWQRVRQQVLAADKQRAYNLYQTQLEQHNQKYEIFKDLQAKYKTLKSQSEAKEWLRQKQIADYKELQIQAPGIKHLQNYLEQKKRSQLSFFQNITNVEKVDYSPVQKNLEAQKSNNPWTREIASLEKSLERANVRETWEEYVIRMRKSDMYYEGNWRQEESWKGDRKDLGRGSYYWRNKYSSYRGDIHNNNKEYTEERDEVLQELKSKAAQEEKESYAGWQKYYSMHPLEYKQKRAQELARLNELKAAETKRQAEIDEALAKIESIKSEQRSIATQAAEWFNLSPAKRIQHPLYRRILIGGITIPGSQESIKVSQTLLADSQDKTPAEILAALDTVEESVTQKKNMADLGLGEGVDLQITEAGKFIDEKLQKQYEYAVKFMKFLLTEEGKEYKRQVAQSREYQGESMLEKAVRLREEKKTVVFNTRTGETKETLVEFVKSEEEEVLVASINAEVASSVSNSIQEEFELLLGEPIGTDSTFRKELFNYYKKNKEGTATSSDQAKLFNAYINLQKVDYRYLAFARQKMRKVGFSTNDYGGIEDHMDRISISSTSDLYPETINGRTYFKFKIGSKTYKIKEPVGLNGVNETKKREAYYLGILRKQAIKNGMSPSSVMSGNTKVTLSSDERYMLGEPARQKAKADIELKAKLAQINSQSDLSDKSKFTLFWDSLEESTIEVMTAVNEPLAKAGNRNAESVYATVQGDQGFGSMIWQLLGNTAGGAAGFWGEGAISQPFSQSLKAAGWDDEMNELLQAALGTEGGKVFLQAMEKGDEGMAWLELNHPAVYRNVVATMGLVELWGIVAGGAGAKAGVKEIREKLKGGKAGVVAISNVRDKVLARIDHIMAPDWKIDRRSGEEFFSGVHSTRATGEGLRIEVLDNASISRKQVDEPYEAIVYAKNSDGVEIRKKHNNGVSTFFPDSWDRVRIMEEVEHAVKYNRGRDLNSDSPNEYYGFSKNGKVQINFYYDEVNGRINSFFPKIN